MQPYLFPYVGYFQLMASVDKFILFDDVNFINRGWINRNRILVGGKDYLFTVPLHAASQNKLINDIQISDESNWKAKLLKTIEQAYKKAPCFNDAYPIISQIINYENLNLAEYIYHSIVTVNKYLGIGCELVPSSSIYNNRHLKGQDRILDICRTELATEYMNLPGGQELYSQVKFLDYGVKLTFIKPLNFIYKQFDSDFEPWLSIIDLMMFNTNDQLAGFFLTRELVN